MSKITNAKYLIGIAENDEKILQRIYQEFLPIVTQYIKKNSGDFEDAKDVFQEGILVVFRKVKDDQLVLSTSFQNYLLGVCRKIWLKKLEKKAKRKVSFEDLKEYLYEEDLEAYFIQTRKWKLYQDKFALLSEECQKVLKMLFNGYSGKEIAQEMSYTDEYAKRKKYKCKLTLIDLIKKDPEYENLKNGARDGNK